MNKWTSRAGQGGLALVGLVALSTGGASCKPSSNVSFDLSVPSGIQDSVAWYEIGAFPGGSCDALSDTLTGGVPQAGATARVVFRPTDTTVPALGDIPRATYAFAVTAKDENCKVLATGCSQVDVSSSSSVSVSLNTVADGAACAGSTSCVDGTCVPPGEGSVDIGAGCSLQLVGSGPLAEALLQSGCMDSSNISLCEATSAPAVTVTPSGFLLAYREFDPSNSTGNIARIVSFNIDANGSAGTPVYTNLPDRCSDAIETDATGIAWNNGEGLIVVSHNICDSNETSGEDAMRVDATGLLVKGGFTSLISPNQQTVHFSSGHGVAPDPSSDKFLVAQLVAASSTKNAAALATFALTDGQQDNELAAKYTTPPDATWTAVTSGSGILASIALGPTTTTSNGIVSHAAGDDAGDDGGAGDDTDAGSGGPVGDSGATTGDDSGADFDAGTMSYAYMHAGDPDAGFGSLPQVGSWEANWASMSASGSRAYVATGANGAAELRTVDASGAVSNGTPVSLSGDGQVVYSDVAFSGDHVFLAVARPGALALVAYSGASGTSGLKQLRQIDLDKDPRVGTFTDLADGHVAIAASDSRVAVVWTTQKTLLERDPVGGYAIYACSK